VEQGYYCCFHYSHFHLSLVGPTESSTEIPPCSKDSSLTVDVVVEEDCWATAGMLDEGGTAAEESSLSEGSSWIGWIPPVSGSAGTLSSSDPESELSEDDTGSLELIEVLVDTDSLEYP
jgi:hypothetical protein